MPAIAKRTAQGLLRFLMLVGLYAAPLALSLPADLSADDTARRAMWAALASPAVTMALAQDVATHLALLLALYGAVNWIASGLSRSAKLPGALAYLLVLVDVWIGLVSGNAMLFAHSNYSIPLETLAKPAWFVASSVALVLMLGRIAWTSRQEANRHRWWLGIAGMVAIVVGLAAWPDRSVRAASSAGPTRDIIIIGIDSLSEPLLRAEQQRLPQLSALMAKATVHPHAYTPLGRTYPAWVSILSGQPPAVHGAMFNLSKLELADRQNLLTRTLQARGYRTVYAIDERRFNNIDETFGFDEVIGPRTGVLDFAIQGLNDTPLTNLLLQTRAARWLLPYSYLNVAAHASYDAQGFVDSIGRASVSPGPLFLAVHFLSAHFPFATRHATMDVKDKNSIRARHVEALTAVDTQVGELLERLRSAGRLEDTFVIVLSDHGEAVGSDEPVRLASGELKAGASYGHGADLLSDHQNRVVLALAHFRHGQPFAAGAAQAGQVSLLDVRAAAERFVRDGRAELQATSECIPVETELRLAAASDYRHLDERRVAAEGIGLYEIDEQGRLRLRQEVLPDLVERKDVGLRCIDRLTVYKPTEGRYHAWRLTPGEPPQEIEPSAADIAQVDNYRRALRDRLRRSAGNASPVAATG